MIKIAICDDENIICKQIEYYVKKYLESKNILFKLDIFYSGEDLIKNLHHKYDLYILDIKMFDISGLDIGQMVRMKLDDYSSKIIYISSNRHYMKDMFKTQPLDFLEKPIQKSELHKALKLAVKLIYNEQQNFSYKKGHEKTIVPFKDILYIAGNDKKIELHLKSRIDTFYGKLDDVKIKINNNRFIQTHKSYIVNYDYIQRFNSKEVELITNIVVPISRTYKEQALKVLTNLIEE